MAYIISSGKSSDGIIINNGPLTTTNGGVQVVLDLPALPRQIIYLDFDGELTRYRNSDLDMVIDDVQVEHSNLTEERIEGIIASLNTKFSVYNVLFTSKRPKDTAYSTIFVGRTSAFDQYGSFAGLAETVDSGNRIKDDNAFVLLDAASADSDIVSTILHEAGHLLGTLDHGGAGLDRYAAYTYQYTLNNCTLSGVLTSKCLLSHYSSDITIVYSRGNNDETDSYICLGSRYDRANSVTLCSGCTLHVGEGGTANNTTVSTYSYLYVCNTGVAYNTTINSNGYFYLSRGGMANSTTINGGYMDVFSLSMANNTTVNMYGYLFVYSGGMADNTTVNSNGRLFVSSGGIVNSTTVSSGGSFHVSSRGSANSTTVNTYGLLFVSCGGTAIETIENGGHVYVQDGANVTFASNSFSDQVLSNTSATVHSGTTANNTTVNFSSSYLRIFSGGTANSTTLNGGYIFLSGCGTANDTTVNDGNMVLSSGGTANNTTVNGGYMVLSNYGVANNTTVISKGCLIASRGGTANNTTVSSGGHLIISSCGTADSTTVSSGGTIYLYSSGKLTGQMAFESRTFVWAFSGGIIDFDISELAQKNTARINDLSLVGGMPVYTLTVSGAQANGKYTLAEGASGFNKTISVVGTSGEELGILKVGQSTMIGNTNYTLNLSDGVLSVNIGDPEPTEVNYKFKDIGQTVYYDGPAPEGSGLTGTLMMIPYTADITMTFDKSLSEGEYEFTIAVAEVPGSVNNCKFQIADAEGIPGINGEEDKWSVAFLSRDACHYGTKIGETDTTVTYKFTDVNDYLLIDSIPDDTLELNVACDTEHWDVAYGAATWVIHDTSNNTVTYYSGEYSDVNKKLVVGKLSGSGKMTNGEPCQFSITVDTSWFSGYKKIDKENNKYEYGANYKIGNNTYTWWLFNISLEVSEQENTTTFTVTPDQSLDASISITVNSDTMTITSIKCGKDISSLEGIHVGDKLKLDLYEKNTSYSLFAPWDDEHCWIAVTANMLATAGYLSEDLTAKKCYEIINKNAYIKKGFNISGSGGGNPTTIFSFYSETFNVFKVYRADSEAIDRNLIFGLEHMQKGNVVGAIGFHRGEAFHIITCYSVTLNKDLNSGTIVYADSDDPSDNIHTESPKEAKIRRKSNGEWIIQIYEKSWFVDGIITLIPNNSKDNNKKITESELNIYNPVLKSMFLYASRFSGASSTSDGVLVSENIYDSVVQDEGNLTIASGAKAEEMIVHTGGTATFNSGSIAKGTIRTTGGTLAVESGVDVSEAEFDFAVSYMDEANDVPMLNSLSNVSGSKLTITIVNGQSAGKYVLAGGATGFNGALSVVGELDFMQTVGKGFEDGLIGELGLDNTLSIEGRTYSLVLEEDSLALVISAEKESPLGIVGDFNGDSRAMLVTESDGVISVYSDGTAWGGLTLDDGWSVAGIGDFNGDGRDDFLRVNEDGYVVGEMSNGNGTFSPQVLNLKNAGWDILGVGDFNGNGTDDVLIANPTAASETVGLLGYWESGVTWTLINGYSAEWEMVSTGDFNGDGKCDMLWRNWFEGEDESIYNAYCTWIVDDPVDWRMVSVANPDEWNFLCAGDFDGNGSHDIAMINDVGVVGIWGVNDGYLNSWSILSAVNPAEWTLAGVADFNGDGTDDIAWCSNTNGLAGYWQINDKQLTAWQNIATIA